MKLVLATPLFPPEIGGPATYANLLLQGFLERGIEIELVKFSEVRHLPRLVRHYAYYRRVLRAAKGADVIFALDPVSVGLPAMLAARRAKKPFVVKIVGDYAWEQGRQRFGIGESLDAFIKRERVPFPVRVLRCIQTRVARSATRIIVPSQYLKRIVAAWGIPEASIEVIYNAVPKERLGAVPEAVRKLSRPFVVSVGRLVPWKRFEGVIEAVAQVPNLSLVIVGDGPGREALEKCAEMSGSHCLFAGQLSHTDTLAVMKESEALVLNSTYEGLSHVLIEAQMLGVPAIVTDAGGNPEIITSGTNGLVVPTDDTAALAKALADFNTLDRSHLAEAARQNAKRFSLEAMMARTSAILTALS